MTPSWHDTVFELDLNEHRRKNPTTTSLATLRTLARIGNLGWDTDRAVLIQRARQVLDEAGISADKYSHMAAASAASTASTGRKKKPARHLAATAKKTVLAPLRTVPIQYRLNREGRSPFPGR